MNSHFTPRMAIFYVAYTDVGEGREHGCGSVANLRNSGLLRAIRRLLGQGWPYAESARMHRIVESDHSEHNLLRPELIRDSLKQKKDHHASD